MVTFQMTLFMNKRTNVVKDYGWVHPLAKTHLLLSVACDEILSWIIEIWMKNHLVNDNNCNTVNLESSKKLRVTNNVALTFSVSDTVLQFTISIEQDN
jgi:hypothetical protein